MRRSQIQYFKSGVHNLLDEEIIPKDALQNAKNWQTIDGKISLVNGKIILGAEGASGKNRGLHKGYQVDGTVVLFRKYLTFIQYWNTTTEAWTNIVTGLTTAAEYSFANSSSLAGNFVFTSGTDGLYKMSCANLGSYCTLYVAATNDKGKMLIDKGRMIMWDCADASKTTIKMSYIDGQDSDVYTTITDEASGDGGGTLAFKSGGATRSCFGIVLTITGSSEVYTDNKDGTLTGSAGGTGTINYISGVYTISNSGVGTVDYQWENTNSKGLSDFTFASTRVAGTGNRITQDIGGDAILSVLIGLDGTYYSLKENSAYQLAISADDATFTNLVFNTDMGIPYFRAGVSTTRGIVFMNTASPDKPELTILERNVLGNVIPRVLFPQFKFSNYSYSDCAIDVFERYIVIACRSAESDFNDTILLGNIAENTIDIGAYPARTFVRDAGILYAGSPITDSVYKILNGFDDESFVISNFATLKDETFGVEELKKVRKLRIQGDIEPDQNIEIWISFDGDEFALLGTISGRGSYVDSGSPRTVGSNMIGEITVGGDNQSTVYPYFYSSKISTPKFRKRSLKFIANSFGYCSIDSITDEDILIFSSRIPKKYRVKAS